MQTPVVVFLDGHRSHLSLELSQFCSSNGIILVSLYPNATHIIQPLDVSVFGPMKQKWKQITRQWRIDHDGVEISKIDIPNALQNFIKDPKMSTNIISGFRTTGICPFNDDAIDYTKLIARTAPVSDFASVCGINSESSENVLAHIKFNETTNCEESDYLRTFEQYPHSSFNSNLSQNSSFQDSLIQEFNQVSPSCSSVPVSENHLQYDDFENELNTITVPNSPVATPASPEALITPSTSFQFTSSTIENALKDVIKYPKQPVSKTKRKLQELPSVLTSKKWQEINVAKETAKTEAENAKLDRKNAAALKKQLKEQKSSEAKEKRNQAKLKLAAKKNAPKSNKTRKTRGKQPVIASSSEENEEYNLSDQSEMDLSDSNLM